MLLFESIADVKKIIFDQRDLVEQAKKCFITASVMCHALNLTRYDDISYNYRSHQYAIDKLFAKEYAFFCSIVNEYNARIKNAHNAKLYKQLIAELNCFLKNKHIVINNNDEIKDQRAEKVKNLYPYALQTSGKLACIYVDPVSLRKIRVILNVDTNMIVTAFEVTDADLQLRCIYFNSIEMLLLSKYGTLDVTPAEIYIAIEQFKHPKLNDERKDMLFKKFFASQGIDPQQKQQAIRQYKKELNGEV